ncbi:hypothetical protein [Cellulomonas sp. B6]|jgi:hypothetical protein|uniref:hypothetical protein n=1 Tax=Cellulomonas sp. B6 TaxID=1295626 RepID=UPI000B1F846A|nr:hypothetical protein [Cellulomonas sp. B6]
METEPDLADAHRAAAALAELASDRAGIVERVALPGWYVAGASTLTAVFVAGPALGDDRSGLLAMLALVPIVLAAVRDRRRRVRPPKAGGIAWGWVLVLLAVVLLLLSVSFGLVAGGLAPWVVLPALAAGGATFAIARRIDAQVRRQVARVR